MANLGLWQGAARGTGTMARTAMGLLQHQSERAEVAARTGLLERQVSLQEQDAIRKKNIYEYQLKQLKQDDTLRNLPMPLSMFVPNYKSFPNVTKWGLEVSEQEGFRDKIKVAPNGDIYAPLPILGALVKAIDGSNERKIKTAQAAMADLNNNIMSLEAEIAEGKLKPDELKARQKQLESLRLRYSRAIYRTESIQKAIAAAAAKPRMPTEFSALLEKHGGDPTKALAELQQRREAVRRAGGQKVGGTMEAVLAEVWKTGKLSHKARAVLNIVRKLEPTKDQAVFRLIANDRFFLDSTIEEQAEKIKRATEVVDSIFGKKESLVGKPPGVYLVDGVEVEWDGKQVIDPALKNMELPRTGTR